MIIIGFDSFNLMWFKRRTGWGWRYYVMGEKISGGGGLWLMSGYRERCCVEWALCCRRANLPDRSAWAEWRRRSCVSAAFVNCQNFLNHTSHHPRCRCNCRRSPYNYINSVTHVTSSGHTNRSCDQSLIIIIRLCLIYSFDLFTRGKQKTNKKGNIKNCVCKLISFF